MTFQYISKACDDNEENWLVFSFFVLGTFVILSTSNSKYAIN